jgi:putative ABC transport system permease protein
LDQLGKKHGLPLVYRIVGRNLRHRRARTLLTALAISVGVTLLLTIVGLADGMMGDQQNRARGAGADIMILPAGSNVIGFSNAPMSDKLVAFAAQQPHVQIATGIVMQSIGAIHRITGIDYETFDRMARFVFVEGGPFESPDDIIVDEFYAQQHKLRVGSTWNTLDKDWRVVGIVEPGKMARVILPIGIVQELTGTVGKISMIYVQLDDPATTFQVIDELKAAGFSPDSYQMYSVEEFASQFTPSAVPEFQVFISIIIGLSVAFGFLVVFLTMHTAVLERTREIGILKSLGATQGYILGILVREALALGLLGSIMGILFSFVTGWVIDTLIPATMQASIVPGWWPRAIGITLVGALLGALYPAIKASRQDALESLSYD